MALIYSDTEPKTFRPFKVSDFDRINPNTQWLKHQENWFYLDFIAKNARARFDERQQAQKELLIADRKMAFWEKHPKFDKDLAAQETARLRKNWRKN